MPKILLQEWDPRGYNAFAHVEAVMHYPEGGPQRDAFFRSALRETLMSMLKDDLETSGAVELGPHEFDAIAHGGDIGALTRNKSFQTRRRDGFLAASCLRFMMAVEAHHRREGLRKLVSWQNYLRAYLYPQRSRSDSLQQFLKHEPSARDKKLRQLRRAYCGVAHFWAAAYDADGRPALADRDGALLRQEEAGRWLRLEEPGLWSEASENEVVPRELFAPDMLRHFLSRAEAIRKKAQELDVYRSVYREFDESQLYTVATEYEWDADPENGIQAGKETLLELRDQKYEPDPLPKAAIHASR